VARSLVLALKLRRRREAAHPLGRAIVDEVWRRGSLIETLTWVPARPRDIRDRGFDHAELIARVVSRFLGIPAKPVLLRTGTGVDQAALGARERKLNLAGMFAAPGVSGHVGVVDDLMTTGATLSEAARALRAGGAQAVEGLVACSVP